MMQTHHSFHIHPSLPIVAELSTNSNVLSCETPISLRLVCPHHSSSSPGIILTAEAAHSPHLADWENLLRLHGAEETILTKTKTCLFSLDSCCSEGSSHPSKPFIFFSCSCSFFAASIHSHKRFVAPPGQKASQPDGQKNTGTKGL